MISAHRFANERVNAVWFLGQRNLRGTFRLGEFDSGNKARGEWNCGKMLGFDGQETNAEGGIEAPKQQAAQVLHLPPS